MSDVPASGWQTKEQHKEQNQKFGIATAYGVLDEFHQSFVPGRDPSVWDILADFAGATVAVMIVPRLYRRWFG